MAYSFTDYAGVRAALGVSAKELPDAVLDESLFTKQLLLALRAEGADILTDYEAALVTPTVVEENFTMALDVYATFCMAAYCLTGLPQFSPKSITDGKAGFSRYADSPFAKTMTAVQDQLAASRRVLQENYAIYQGSALADAVPITLLQASTLTTDPVTGE